MKKYAYLIVSIILLILTLYFLSIESTFIGVILLIASYFTSVSFVSQTDLSDKAKGNMNVFLFFFIIVWAMIGAWLAATGNPIVHSNSSNICPICHSRPMDVFKGMCQQCYNNMRYAEQMLGK